MFDRVIDAKRYTKFNFRSTYNVFRIKNNKLKTAFHCRFDHFKYKIIFFELVNAPVIFQNYINMVLKKYFDIFVLVYLDDIFIYLMDKIDYA